MTQDEVVELARKLIHDDDFDIGFSFAELHDFAQRIADQERSKCAKEVEDYVERHDREYKELGLDIAYDLRTRL